MIIENEKDLKMKREEAWGNEQERKKKDRIVCQREISSVFRVCLYFSVCAFHGVKRVGRRQQLTNPAAAVDILTRTDQPRSFLAQVYSKPTVKTHLNVRI